ncbi:MAG: S-adenosylmethionine decarboxylase [Candidatus Eisenbacteria bacterium]|nr:S-adenosylmethionine decarboxylase [Candidatus Eisenbacteria bacterium]
MNRAPAIDVPVAKAAPVRKGKRVERPAPRRMGRHAQEPALWGLATSIDIYHCDPATIRDAEKIRRFVVELCELIEMRRFGDTLVVHFGEDERVAGYSMVQLIETSLISAHFANLTNTVYLDVFSCKMYDPEVVANFAQQFFGGAHCITHVTPRL